MNHILIIEDDATICKIYSQVLIQNGYDVTTTENGPDGMRIFSQKKVDLLLLDIMLPGGMNGFDILQQLKHDDQLKNLPVIVLTNLESEKQTAMDYGAVDYILKVQIDTQTLLNKISAHLPKTS